MSSTELNFSSRIVSCLGQLLLFTFFLGLRGGLLCLYFQFRVGLRVFLLFLDQALLAQFLVALLGIFRRDLVATFLHAVLLGPAFDCCMGRQAEAHVSVVSINSTRVVVVLFMGLQGPLD